MWNRAELKERAKVAFKRNYWKCVLVAFILSILTGSGSSGGVNNQDANEILQHNYYYENGEYYEQDHIFEDDILEDEIFDEEESRFLVGLAIAAVWIAIISFVVGIFVLNPLEIGGCYFFTNNAYSPASVKDIGVGFRNGRYWKSVGVVFLRNLFIALWSLLLVIPGIIKGYEYRMVTYLIAEHPEMSREEAFRISKEMMRGQKMDAFILDLSFFGWYLVAAFTLGIAGIFYVSPYVHATDAELYITLRNQFFYRTDTMNY